MTYHYENLNDATFQQLVQALLVATFPDTTCFPVRQPDGGRDAILYDSLTAGGTGFTVFQVKFSPTPDAKEERDAIEAAIRTERSKVETLVRKGANRYYLVTNVRGTAHLDVGSIDKVHQALTESFSIPASVWWRDDIDARLDTNCDVKWSYPSICRGTDVLSLLLRNIHMLDTLRATRAITSYMGQQQRDDREVKFTQVELKGKLTDLFVDLPIGHKHDQPADKARRRRLPDVEAVEQYVALLRDVDNDEDTIDPRLLAASFFLRMPFGKGVSRFVLEGAPGQGKSTVTQFLCQLSRLKLLPTDSVELRAVGEVHKDAPTRTPFRVDMRDYASWVAGRHPYDSDSPSLEAGRSKSLESFLAMQVSWHSGGLTVSEHDLVEFLTHAHSLIVLDGFDEVADSTTREILVDEICSAADRLDIHARSLQIVVTSRPVAFANSPGFPENNWTHLELTDLRWSNIVSYKQKWSAGNELNITEDAALDATLKEKLEQPHLRDLSRNPMQLAILLRLMQLQGAALPDKRTALYDEYMKVFMNREVEKRQIAGDHRELILSIHGVLAWELQTGAETGEGSGRITFEGMKERIGLFLAEQEHDAELLDVLFKRSVERVGALVARVQGTLEFEVQPLREYFAARHLYKTASYSPPGRPKSGTRPDRFDALAGSFYWTNVTRFFCGFYDVGELPSLVDGLIEIGNAPGYRQINQPRRLAMMLLSDYVFADSPRSIRRLVKFITEEPAFERLTNDGFGGQRETALPPGAGGRALFDTCITKLGEPRDRTAKRAIRATMARNATPPELLAYFRNVVSEVDDGKDALRLARDLRVQEMFDAEEISELSRGDTLVELTWLVEAGRHEVVLDSERLHQRACQAVFDLEASFVFEFGPGIPGKGGIFSLERMIHPILLADYFHRGWSAFPGGPLGRDAKEERSSVAKHSDTSIGHLVATMETVLADVPSDSWHCDLSPWARVVDSGFEAVPRAPLFSMIAVLALAVGKQAAKGEGAQDDSVDVRQRLHYDKSQGSWDERAFFPEPGLVLRLYYARRHADNARWWQDQLAIADEHARPILLCALMSIADARVIGQLCEEIAKAVDELAEQRWSWLRSALSSWNFLAHANQSPLSADWVFSREVESTRLALLLTGRLAEEVDVRRLARRWFSDCNGADPEVLQYAVNAEVFSGPNDEVDWERACELSILARLAGVTYLFRHGEWGRQINVPDAVAERVLDNCQVHSEQFVSMCERSRAASVAQSAPRVSSVAGDHGWFDVDEGG